MSIHCAIKPKLRLRCLLTVQIALAFYACAKPAPAALVTIWEDQFTSINAGWQVPFGSSLVSLATPGNVAGSQDGFEARFTNTTGTAAYATFTIPADLIQVGDRVQYSIRSDFSNHFAADRVNLVAPNGGNAFDSGFVAHASSGGLTYRAEPGYLFTVANTTLSQPLRATTNLYLGNNGYGGSGVDSTFYIDYIRIVGERDVNTVQSWVRSSSGSWHDAQSWNGGIPNANSHQAVLGGVNTTPTTVALGSPATVNSIQFSSANGYAIAGHATLTLASNLGNATIEVLQAATAGAHQFQSPVGLGTDADVLVSGAAPLLFNNTLALNGHTLNLLSGTTIINNNASTGTGTIKNSAVLAGGGTIAGHLMNDTSGTLRSEIVGPGPSDTSTLTVAGTATLAGTLDVELGSYSPRNGQKFTVLSAGTLVNNGITLHASDIDRFLPSIVGNTFVLTAFGSGDFNGDGSVDAADYVVWRNTLGSSVNLFADGDGSGMVDQGDYQLWKSQFGSTAGSGAGLHNSHSVPEPTSLVALSVALTIIGGRLQRSRRKTS